MRRRLALARSDLRLDFGIVGQINRLGIGLFETVEHDFSCLRVSLVESLATLPRPNPMLSESVEHAFDLCHR